MIRTFVLALCSLFAVFGAQADAAPVKVQVINFTAEWCPVCKVFDPNLEQALHELQSSSFEWRTVDMTLTKTGTRDQKNRLWIDFFNNMKAADLMVVHKGYNGYPYTGYAVVIAADTKEPLVCMAGAMSRQDIKNQLTAALTRVSTRPAGKRVPQGADCPQSFLN